MVVLQSLGTCTCGYKGQMGESSTWYFLVIEKTSLFGTGLKATSAKG